MPVLEAFPDPADFALSWMIGTTGNMSALREQVIEVGLLDETFTRWGLEDTDLCYRLVQSGARMAVREATLNHHQVPPPPAARASSGWSTSAASATRSTRSNRPSTGSPVNPPDRRPHRPRRSQECTSLTRSGQTAQAADLRHRYEALSITRC